MRAGAWPVVKPAFAQLWSTTEANTFPTNGTENYVNVVGADFASGPLSDDWTFTAAGCLLTYVGGDTIIVDATLILVVENPSGGNIFGSPGPNHNNDLLAVNTNTNSGDFANTQTELGIVVTGVQMQGRRILQLVTGDVIRPAYGATTGGGQIGLDSPIDRIQLIVTQLGVVE